MLGALMVTVVHYPLSIGRTVEVHPVTVLLGVGAGTSVLGFVGAFLATPVVAAVSAAAGWLRDDVPLDGPAPEDETAPGRDPLAAPSSGAG